MNRILFGSAEMNKREIRYYLISEKSRHGWTEYGLAVEFADEQAQFPSLTLSRGRVQELLSRMRRGTVTPVAVRDVVEDWLLA